MAKWKRVVLAVAVLVALAIGAGVLRHYTTKDIVGVQTGTVARQNLVSQVTASGEVRPKTYTNVLGEGFGKITEIAVREGDAVRVGDMLLQVESIQPAADVEAQRAALASTDAAVNSAEANYRAARAEVAQRQADFDRARLDWERARELFEGELISRQEYDMRRAAYQSAEAGLQASTARHSQTESELVRSRSLMNQSRAVLTRAQDVLRKTTYTAPIPGVVTFIAARVGENVVPGIQNSPGSYLMTISDMSVVTAEVKVDETDIISLQLGQPAEVTIDALPGRTFQGRVTEVGTQAVLRTSGLATTQITSGAQEAKDFKVVITLAEPPEVLRPGLSTTGRIRTAERQQVLTVPLQALAVRTRKDLEEAAKETERAGVTLAAPPPAAAGDADPAKEEIQGVFVVRDGRAVFVPVKTGITGITDIEVIEGLKEGDQIVTGSYRVLRTLRPGSRVKVEREPQRQPGTE
jgi:HlyD family secretion protein